MLCLFVSHNKYKLFDECIFILQIVHKLKKNYEMDFRCNHLSTFFYTYNKMFKYSRFYAISMEKSYHFISTVFFGISQSWSQCNCSVKIYH